MNRIHLRLECQTYYKLIDITVQLTHNNVKIKSHSRIDSQNEKIIAAIFLFCFKIANYRVYVYDIINMDVSNATFEYLWRH